MSRVVRARAAAARRLGAGSSEDHQRRAGGERQRRHVGGRGRRGGRRRSTAAVVERRAGRGGAGMPVCRRRATGVLAEEWTRPEVQSKHAAQRDFTCAVRLYSLNVLTKANRCAVDLQQGIRQRKSV